MKPERRPRVYGSDVLVGTPFTEQKNVDHTSHHSSLTIVRPGAAPYLRPVHARLGAAHRMSARVPLLTALVAAEIAIVLVAAYSFSGAARTFGNGWHAFGMHTMNYAGSALPALEAGSSPNVLIDDMDDGVTVTPSTDGRVHVTDMSYASGWGWSNGQRPKLTMTRTAGGVSISRPSESDDTIEIFGSSREHIDVQVPPNARLSIVHSSGADVTGLNANVAVHSDDGHITVKQIRGNVALATLDGAIEADDVVANSFTASSNDGHIDATALHVVGSGANANLHTDDGHITVAAEFAPGGNYSIASLDGHVNVTLPSTSDLGVTASTDDGRIVRDGKTVADGDGPSNTSFTLGAGSGHLHVSTNDGTIEFTTNGAI